MIKELIKITEVKGKKAVSARELHDFLGSKRQFANWIHQRIKKYGFVENQDYEVFNNFVINPDGGRPLTEYALSINMAKELSMVEGNERGKQARLYFIQCEEMAARAIEEESERRKNMTGAEYLLEQAKFMVEQERRIASVERDLNAIKMEREEARAELLSAKLSSEKTPEMPMRDQIRQLVNKFAVSQNISQRDVWHKVYEKLYYLYHISIKSYKKVKKGETNLDIAERIGFLDKLYNIASDLVREYEIE